MSIYYEQHGHGPDVVLVHGWGLHGGVWSDVARVLSAEYRVTVPDLPGHGRSRDFLPREFTPEVLAGEVQRVLPGPAIWVGWSLGGFVALAAAQRAPGAVAKLVLEQFALNLEQDYAATLDRFLSLQMAAGEDRAVLRRLCDKLFRHGEPPAAALHQGLQLLKQEDRRASLPGIAVPALVVHGERDRITPVGAARFLAARLPRARLELVPGAGHAPFLSHTSHFLEKLKDFMHD